MTASAAAASAAAVVAPVIGDAAVVAAIPTPHANGSVSMTGDYYFDSYSHYGIHMEMLKDSHRTGSYRDAILMNPQLFRGKTVLDVGCGTGILSMFAAKAGAKRVIAVDCSSIAHQAREIVKLNGFGDVITVLHGKLEELPWPEGVGKVDIIISEWMGYFLLYESMLQSVLYARDKYGAPDVKLLPSHANMFITGITDAQYIEDRFDVWNDIEGFDFSYCRRLCYIEPLVDTASPDQIVTTCETLVQFDLAKVKEEELSFKSDVTLVATRNETIHALEVHFDTPFEAGHERVNLETAPWTQTTHWRQSMLYLVNPLRVAKGDRIRVQLTCAPNADNKRDLDIHVRVDMDGTYQVSHFDQDFRMR